jgi:hypothetical protein
MTDFAQAMAEKYRMPGNAVEAYPKIYIGEKAGFAIWTKNHLGMVSGGIHFRI